MEERTHVEEAENFQSKMMEIHLVKKVVKWHGKMVNYGVSEGILVFWHKRH